MTKEERIEKGKQLFSSGYNCAQAVVLAYADKLDADESFLNLASAPFGGGVGRLREVCGSVSGMVMVISLATKKNTLERDDKMALYALEREAAEKFREKNGAIVCKELLALHPHDDVANAHKPACRDLVGSAIEIIEDMNIFGE